MLRLVLLSMLNLLAIHAFSSTKSCTELVDSPKATREKYIGDHIQNLAAHRQVNLEPENTMTELGGIPVWLSLSPDSQNPWVYSGTFWEIEPTGEYIYFLAGDYKKNEKGLLRFPTATTSVRVELNFEDDVIAVKKIDGLREQGRAERQANAVSFVTSLTVGDLLQRVPASNLMYEDRVSFVSLRSLLKGGQTGLARLIVHKPSNGKPGYVSVIYQEQRPPKNGGELPRYLEVVIKSGAEEMQIKVIVEQFLKLVDRYSNMPYVCLSGTTRV